MEKHTSLPFCYMKWKLLLWSSKSEWHFNPSHYSGEDGTIIHFCGRIHQLIQFFVRNSLFIWDTSKQKVPPVNSVSREMTYYLPETCHTLKLFFRLSEHRKTWKGLLYRDTYSLVTWLHKEKNNITQCNITITLDRTLTHDSQQIQLQWFRDGTTQVSTALKTSYRGRNNPDTSLGGKEGEKPRGNSPF